MLNILPAAKKSQIQKEQMYQLIRSSTVSIVLFFILVDAGLLGTRFMLGQWVDRLRSEHQIVTISEVERAEVENTLSELTLTMQSLNSIQQNYLNPAMPLTGILNAFPANSQVDSLAIHFAEERIEVSGVVKDREAFIALQGQLNSTPQLSDIHFEVTSLTQKTNIPFEFNAAITYEETEN